MRLEQINGNMRKWKIDKSSIHGYGIFANQNLDLKDNLGLGFEKVKNTGKPDSDYRRTMLGMMINHSDQPNVELFNIKNKYYIITLKKITSGKELLIDYSSFPWDGERNFI